PEVADDVEQQGHSQDLDGRRPGACVHGRASSSTGWEWGWSADVGCGVGLGFGFGFGPARGTPTPGRAGAGPCVNWLKRSIRGPSELDKIDWNDGAILPIRRFRASAEPSPSNADTRAARPASSALLLNRMTSASAWALATMAEALSFAAS